MPGSARFTLFAAQPITSVSELALLSARKGTSEYSLVDAPAIGGLTTTRVADACSVDRLSPSAQVVFTVPVMSTFVVVAVPGASVGTTAASSETVLAQCWSTKSAQSVPASPSRRVVLRLCMAVRGRSTWQGRGRSTLRCGTRSASGWPRPAVCRCPADRQEWLLPGWTAGVSEERSARCQWAAGTESLRFRWWGRRSFAGAGAWPGLRRGRYDDWSRVPDRSAVRRGGPARRGRPGLPEGGRRPQPVSDGPGPGGLVNRFPWPVWTTASAWGLAQGADPLDGGAVSPTVFCLRLPGAATGSIKSSIRQSKCPSTPPRLSGSVVSGFSVTSRQI